MKNLLGPERGAKRVYLYPSRRVYRYCPCARHGGLHLYLFNRISPTLTRRGGILQRRAQVRRVQLNALRRRGVRQRYQLAARSPDIWPSEIAQRVRDRPAGYGFQSVLGFEEIPAFSPEDLYSNLLGAAGDLTSSRGHGGQWWQQAMEAALEKALTPG